MSIPQVVAGLQGAGGRLVRAWPRSPVHLQVEAEVDGRSIAGQWFADPRHAARVHAGTTASQRVDEHLVLQPDGHDRKLIALAELAGRADGRLVAHRPERRGVVGHRHEGRRVFTKMVRPAALARTEMAARAAAGLPVRTPRVLAVDRAASSVTTEALPGVTLHDLLGTDRAVDACRRAGEALARVHAVPLPSGVRVHGRAEEDAVLARWSSLARAHGVPGPAHPRAALPEVGTQVLLHRDLHDKQLLVDTDGAVGVLDFDLLAAGDPALDLGNLLVHLDLRVAQGLADHAAPLRAAVLEGYRPAPDVTERLPAWEQATRNRLAAVYAFRPRWRQAAWALGASA